MIKKTLQKPAVSAAFIFLLGMCLFPLQSKLDQKKGIHQTDKSKKVSFNKVWELKIDFTKVPLKQVKKAAFYGDKIFILDGKREQIYVLNPEGSFLYQIGRPGQGPGDLEYSQDFCFSPDRRLHVLNMLPRRIAVFDLEGNSLSTVKLKMPTAYTYPEAILADNHYYFLASPLNHMVMRTDQSGNHLQTLVERKNKLKIPGKNIVFEPQFAFTPSTKKNEAPNILYFDRYSGRFTKLSADGEVLCRFSAYSEGIDVSREKIEREFYESKKGFGEPQAHSMISINLWSRFDMDAEGNIYVTETRGPKDGNPGMYVFAPDGTFLYRIGLPIFKNVSIAGLICRQTFFLFWTHNFDFVKISLKN